MPSGTKPKCVRHLGDCLLDEAFCLDDDRLNDEHLAADLRRFAADGAIEDVELRHLAGHLALDRELGRTARSLNHHANRSYDQTVALVDRLRERREAATKTAPQHPHAA